MPEIVQGIAFVDGIKQLKTAVRSRRQKLSSIAQMISNGLITSTVDLEDFLDGRLDGSVSNVSLAGPSY
ncbi:MAG: hypothetical protein GDA40_05435 [Rhodobacteraceae bacterium]|nr:hypothetical protein [Paracoccaceae bacterium]